NVIHRVCNPQRKIIHRVCIYLLQTSGKFLVASSSVDFFILIWQSLDFPMDQLIQEVFRVLKAGGTTLIRKSSQSAVGLDNKMISNLENKLLLAGFSEIHVLQSTLPSRGISFGA
uniref:Anamorsin homolog n=1 Tax=Cicer arietinum TaxID=3827 RepID=A0A1S3DWL8_CICAR